MRWILRFTVVLITVCLIAAAFGATYERIQSRRDLGVAPPPGHRL